MNAVARFDPIALIESVFDTQTFNDLDLPTTHSVVSPEYGRELDAAKAKSGSTESVLTGIANLRGQPVVLIVSDFGFLAGSVGARSCALVINALRVATSRGLPVFASPASGGTRMQEGTAAFALMVDVASAVADLRAAGLPMLVWLRNPTTGGVMATWGSLGTVTWAEPGALTGFLGPRVYRALNGVDFPEGIQTGEHLASSGVIDEVVWPAELRDRIGRVLAVTDGSPAQRREPDVEEVLKDVFIDDWDAVVSSRDPLRPGITEFLAWCTEVTEVFGSGEGDVGPAIRVALARVDGVSAVVVGQDREAQRRGNLLGPAALKVARRGFRLATELRLPLVTVIDTAGAELSANAEEGGLAGQISRCLAELAALPVPTVSVILGMGCGGGALALLPADRVLCAARGWLSPLPLEGASIIKYRTPDRADEMARLQGVGAQRLKAAGVVDTVIPEHPDAVLEPSPFIIRLVGAVAIELDELNQWAQPTRLVARRARYAGGVALLPTEKDSAI